MLKKTLLVISWCLMGALVPAGSLHALVGNGKADKVLGQTTFTGSSGATSQVKLSSPTSIIIDTVANRTFVADAGNNRVLWWNSIKPADGANADGVLGQALFTVGTANRGVAANAGTLRDPHYLAVDAAGNLWVSDTLNNRVLRYSVPLSSAMNAGLSIGQPTVVSTNSACAINRLNSPQGLAFDPAGNLWVADMGNYRILRFPQPFATNMSADIVIGQPDFTSHLSNRGAAPAANSLFLPRGICFDRAGNLYVVDDGNCRVLRYNAPLATNMSASVVVGQDTLTGFANGCIANRFNGPEGVAIDPEGCLWVTDRDDSRALRFSPPFTNGMSADAVLGQANFTSGSANRGVSASTHTLNNPLAIQCDLSGNIRIADSVNNRTLLYYFPRIYSVTPSSGSNAGVPAVVNITGQGFTPDVVARLTKTGQTTVTASSTSYQGEGSLRATFNPDGCAEGNWNVVLEAGNAVFPLSDSLPGGFRVYPMSILSIDPLFGMNVGTVSFSILGAGFLEGSAIKLAKAGETNILPTTYTVINAVRIDGTFDLTGKRTGLWDISISSGSRVFTFAGRFEVRSTAAESRTVDPAGGTVTLQAETGDVQASFPPQTFPEAVTVTVSAIEPPVADRDTIKLTSIGVEVKNDRGYQPQKEILLTVHYRDGDVTGFDESKLAVALYDETARRWNPLVSETHPEANYVAAKIRHLSRFALLELVPAQNTAQTVVYPNPFRAGRENAFIRFSMPEAGTAELTLYSEYGERIVSRVLDNLVPGQNEYAFDGRDNGGRTLFSGSYVCVFTKKYSGRESQETWRLLVVR